MTESVPTQIPLVGLEMSSETAQYVGMLEGTIAAMCINECKYRALLEILTGESWEATKVGMDPNALMGLAVSALVKQTGMDAVKAQTLVSRRWAQSNPVTNAVVPKAVSVDTLVSGEGQIVAETASPTVSIRDRFADWKQRQLDDAATVPDPEPESSTSVPESNGTDVPQN